MSYVELHMMCTQLCAWTGTNKVLNFNLHDLVVYTFMKQNAVKASNLIWFLFLLDDCFLNLQIFTFLLLLFNLYIYK